MPNTELSKTLVKLSSISEYARKDLTYEFTSLAHYLNVEFLRNCYISLNRNKAVGVDRVYALSKYSRELG